MDNNQRPQIKIPMTTLDKLLTAFSASLIIAAAVFSVYAWMHLPSLIPTHFDWSGKIDEYGSRDTIFAMVPVMLLFFGVFSWLCKYPWHLNYIVTITDENAAAQYRIVVTTFRWLLLVITITFGYIEFCTVMSAMQERAFLNPTILIIMLAAMFILLGRMVVMSLRRK